MKATPRAHPMYLDSAPDPVFAMFHPATPVEGPRTAVLIVPPWGWDDVSSYRSRRTWAEHLAAAGHPTLRIDLPGTGDSAGLPGDAARLGSWSASVRVATAWLSSSTAGGRVAVIGLGLGGLVAAKALADGAIVDDLVLWAAPERGRAFLREQRAFANLQSSRYGPTGDAGPTLLPDGWLEVGGFVLSAETIRDLDGLDLASLATGQLKRALLLDRDGIAMGTSVSRRFEGAGVEVSEHPGDGWGAMCFHPEQHDPPLDVIQRVTSWIGEAGTTGAAPARRVPSSPDVLDELELVIDGNGIRERAFEHDQGDGRSFGILAEPIVGSSSDLCAVFLNAGAVRRIGPNRMWVEAARRWAARGVPTLRIDVEGLGDADGDAGMYVDVGRFYTPDRGEQVRAQLDALGARGYGPRFALVGLCAGGYWAFNTAAADARVVTAVVLNPRALVWDPDLVAGRDARQVRRLLEPGLWRRILHGEIEATRIRTVTRALAGQAWRHIARRAGRPSGPNIESLAAQLERTFEQLRDAGTRIVLAFSSDEPVYDELERDGILSRVASWPGVVIESLPAADHTVRPIVAQNAVHALLDRELTTMIEASRRAMPMPGPIDPDRHPGIRPAQPPERIAEHG